MHALASHQEAIIQIGLQMRKGTQIPFHWATLDFVDDHSQLDFTLKYKINDNLTIKAEGINLTDEPEYYYWGYKDRLSQYDEYGTTFSVGFRYTY